MAQLSDNSFEARILDLESAVRSLQSTNLTDRASVVNAAGASVPLSSLAFGQVAIVDPRDTVSVQGTLNTASGSGWVDRGGPYLDVNVRGQALLVDFTTQLTVEGIQPGGGMSYVLRGPAATQAGAATAPIVVNGDTWRSVWLGDSHSTSEYVNLTAGGASFGFHSGLAPGWYRIAAVYTLGWSSSPTYTPRASFYGMTFAATPL